MVENTQDGQPAAPEGMAPAPRPQLYSGGSIFAHMWLLASIWRLFLIVCSRHRLSDYVQAFRGTSPDTEVIKRLDEWIEVVASRSQTLLQFNAVVIAILAFGSGNDGEFLARIVAIWVLATVPLLLNIFVFLNRPVHYQNVAEIEIPWTLRKFALRGFIFNMVLAISAVCALLAASAKLDII